MPGQPQPQPKLQSSIESDESVPKLLDDLKQSVAEMARLKRRIVNRQKFLDSLPEKPLTRAQVRDYDRRAIDDGMPGLLLMENAGRGAAELLLSRNPQRVTVCCGKGNNGGDGFVIARYLDNAGVRVEALLFCEPQEIAGDAAVMLRILRQTHVPVRVNDDNGTLIQELAAADWIVDALFGTGLTGPVRPPFDQVIVAINASGKPVLAVDIPSGLDCDTGQPLGAAVRATVTATFVAQKVGFQAPEAKLYLGEVHVVDVGAPSTLLEKYRSITPR